MLIEFVQVRLAQKESLSIAISKPGALLGLGALLDRQFQYSSFFIRCHGRRPAGRASLQKHFLPLEMPWPFEPWSFGIALERVQAVLLFKLNLRRNSMRYYPSNFTEMTASTQNIICWTVHMVGWHKVTSNQNNKWCIGELMLLSLFASVWIIHFADVLIQVVIWSLPVCILRLGENGLKKISPG